MFINNNFNNLIFLNYYWLQINTNIKCRKRKICDSVFYYLLTRAGGKQLLLAARGRMHVFVSDINTYF